MIEAVASQRVITEVERNLEEKMPAAMPAFRMLVSRCLQVVSDPSVAEIEALSKAADAKDVPILAAASARRMCFPDNVQYSTFSARCRIHTVPNAGDLVQRVRYLLAKMSSE